ncbi:hypothetical protein [Undibacterium sp. YM2]|uniref:hypothetical protein n=1 Tax=Undibacterium sp. YM2 TaxID=2058625 RepID=UPI00138998D4|nr:hypothetical protein [Undibacterium sp. YM2]
MRNYGAVFLPQLGGGAGQPRSVFVRYSGTCAIINSLSSLHLSSGRQFLSVDCGIQGFKGIMEFELLNISPIKNAIIGSSIWATMLLSGCASLHLDERNPHINVKAAGGDTSVPRAHYASRLGCTTSTVAESDPCPHPMFVGVAISGGGLRAANFGLG